MQQQKNGTKQPIQRHSDKWLTVAQAEESITECCCGGAGYVRLRVPRTHSLFGKAIRCVCKQQADALEQAKRMRDRSGMTDIQLTEWTLETWDPEAVVAKASSQVAIAKAREIKELCQRYACNPVGWFTLSGHVGTGKSHLAFGVGAEMLKQGRSAYVATAPDLLQMLRETMKENRYEQTLGYLRHVDAVIIDDLGAEKSTDWTAEAFYNVLNWRYTNRMPVMITTNEMIRKGDPRKIASIDTRILSRMKQGVIRILDYGDYRERH